MSSADYEVNQGYIRKRFRPLPGSTEAKAEYTSVAPVAPLGHTRQTVTTSASALGAIPQYSRRMHVFNLSPDYVVYFTDTAAQTPSGSLGFPIQPLSWLMYDSEPTTDFKMIAVGGSATLAFAFYG